MVKLQGIFLAFFIFWSLPLRAQLEPLEQMQLIEQLVRDGNFQRAEMVMDELASEDLKSAERPRFYLARAALQIGGEDYKSALETLSTLSGGSEFRSEFYMLKAQALAGLGMYSESLVALGKSDDRSISHYSLKGRGKLETGDSSGAYRALREGMGAHPSSTVLPRQMVALLLGEGLFGVALDLAFHHFSNFEEYLGLAQELERLGRHQLHVEVLEVAHVRFPNNQYVVLELVRVLLGRGMPLSAAGLVEKLAAFDPTYALEAAELYRQLGSPLRARYWLDQVPSSPGKLKIEIAVAIQEERYSHIASLEPQVSRLADLDDEMRYAVAYSLFKSRDLKRARVYLAEIQRPEMQGQVALLLEAMDED